MLLWMPVGMQARPGDFEIGPKAPFQSYPPEACGELNLALIKSVVDAGRGKEAWLEVRGEILGPRRVSMALQQYKAGKDLDV